MHYLTNTGFDSQIQTKYTGTVGMEALHAPKTVFKYHKHITRTLLRTSALFCGISTGYGPFLQKQQQ